MRAMKDGGPAFPQPGVYDGMRKQVNPVGAYYDAGGVSIRDYFAAKAMAVMLAEEPDPYPTWWMSLTEGSNAKGIDRIAKAAYIAADAMLRAREAKS